MNEYYTICMHRRFINGNLRCWTCALPVNRDEGSTEEILHYYKFVSGYWSMFFFRISSSCNCYNIVVFVFICSFIGFAIWFIDENEIYECIQFEYSSCWKKREYLRLFIIECSYNNYHCLYFVYFNYNF